MRPYEFLLEGINKDLIGQWVNEYYDMLNDVEEEWELHRVKF